MTKTRIEGLIATFPKLIGLGKQHTFVETESVRYVYQPLEELYVLLITTKASNILEDLETLRLFARVIPEYGCGTDESDIIANAFQLIFAFDEIVALGYREDVNMSQVRTFTEMDSHEERVFRAIQANKERDAKEQMKQRARELQLARLEANKKGLSGNNYAAGNRSMFGGFGSTNGSDINEQRISAVKDGFSYGDVLLTTSSSLSKPLSHLSNKRGGGMQLGGGESGGIDCFVDRLKAEGESVHDVAKMSSVTDSTTAAKLDMISNLTSMIKKEDLHIRIEEKLIVQAGRNGGLENMELQGIMYAQANTNDACTARMQVDTSMALNPSNADRPAVQLQTHPNIDKKVFASSNWIQIKVGGKAFPVGQEVGVLRWRLQTQDDMAIPIIINCWPNEIPGGYEVTVEYELKDLDLEIENILVTIPLPPYIKAPMIGNCDGDCDVHKAELEWRLPILNADNSTGSIEFTLKTDAKPDHFFPIQLAFKSNQSYCNIKLIEATTGPQDTPIKFSFEQFLFTEKYEIV